MKSKPKQRAEPVEIGIGSHHDLRVRTTDEKKRALAINPRVDQLWVQGRLQDSQYLAAGRLYKDWALGVEGASNRDMFNSVHASGVPTGVSETQLIAMTQFRAAMKGVANVLGETAAHVLLLSVCMDYSFKKISVATRIDADVVPSAVVMCIVALAAYYETVDGAKAS